MRVLAIVLSLLVSGVAYGAPPSKPAASQSDRPWAEGVSEKNQTEAIKLFTEGTKLLKDAFFTKAVELYKQALEFWDHPAIHFNLAKTYMNLDNPVDAYKHLKLSMKFDGKPLDPDQIEQVKKYIDILYTSELSEIVVVVKEPGAKVSLDGTQLFTAPGSWTGVVKPGRRTILATKTGFQPHQEQPDLKAGQKTTLELKLTEVDTNTRYVRKFGNWIPWTVIGAGAAMLGGGGVLTWQATEAFADYDNSVDICNSTTALTILDDTGRDTGGRVHACMPTSDLQAKKDKGELFNTLGVASFIAGGATLVTGFVLLYVNREQPVTEEVPVAITPYMSPDGAGLSATIGF